MTNSTGAVDLRDFDMRVDGLRTTRVGPSERHQIEFNVYDLLKHQYAIAGRDVSDAVLVDDAMHLKRDLQRLQHAHTKPAGLKRRKASWWLRLLR